ncbi:MAG: peptidylprolyl isomerase [Alphaproteobacteria bacterium]|nr:peptidylprolyl isomerase [Alphaproteobacteria bacterium]
MRRNLLLAVLVLILGLAAPPAGAQEGPKVRLTTDVGVIDIALDPQRAPKTVANFLSYVQSGHYDGTIFHRVIRGFMIQGGGFTTELRQKPTRGPIPNEADNGLRNRAGTIAMARTSRPHSATAQFFINTVDNAFLDHTAPDARGWGYAVFGRVVSGMDVVRRIEETRTERRGRMGNLPTPAIVIQKAEVLR